MRVDWSGQPSLFAQVQPSMSGLTSALGVVDRGFVFVGSTPSADGTAATVQQGSLLVFDGNGKLLLNYVNRSYIDGPWGMAIYDLGNDAHIFGPITLAAPLRAST